MTQLNESDLNTGAAEHYPHPQDTLSWSSSFAINQSDPLDLITIGSSSSEPTTTTTGEEPTTTTDGATLSFPHFQAYETEPTVGDPIGGTGIPGLLWGLDEVPHYVAVYVPPELGLLLSPDTDGMTTNGSTIQKSLGLDKLQGYAGNDGVSRDAAPSPTSTLIALATAGRNPADITLPTAGSEASSSGGGGDAVIQSKSAASGSSTPAWSPAANSSTQSAGSSGLGGIHPADDPPPVQGSHEGPLNEEDIGILQGLGIDQAWIDNAVDENIPAQLVFEVALGQWNKTPEKDRQPLLTLTSPTPMEVVEKIADKIEPVLVKGGAIAGAVGNVAGVFAGGTLLADPDPAASKALGIFLITTGLDGLQANVRTLTSGQGQPTVLHHAIQTGAMTLGADEREADRWGRVADINAQTAAGYKLAIILPVGQSPNPADPGMRGNINPMKDRIVFREYSLSRERIEGVSPFSQALSDAGGQPIRVVVTPSGERSIMQGNHRVYGAQEQGLQSIEGIIYTPEQWESLAGSPFVLRGTNNPKITP